MRNTLLIAAAALSGCTTVPVASTTATPATAIIDTGVMTPRPGTAVVVITRDKGMKGSACMFDVYLDGGRIASLKVAEQLTFYPAPGTHIIGVQAQQQLCGGGVSQIEATLAADQRKLYRVGMGYGWDIRIEP